MPLDYYLIDYILSLHGRATRLPKFVGVFAGTSDQVNMANSNGPFHSVV